MKRGLAIALVLSITIGWTVPALGGPSLSTVAKRVKKLERRVNALARIVLQQHVQTSTDSVFARDLGDGYKVGDPRCLQGKATGGGVKFSGTGYTINSHPTRDGLGWHFYGRGDGPVEVYVVCTFGP